MVVHLNKFFPRQCKTLGEAETLEAIREGIGRAAGYDIVAERNVCKFIDLMFAFGREFDRDRNLPWAQEILNDESLPDPTKRIDRTYEQSLRYVRNAAGINAEGEA